MGDSEEGCGEGVTCRYCEGGWPRDLECVNLEIDMCGLWVARIGGVLLVRGLNVGSCPRFRPALR